ncbi:class I SAM-dependent methyltransferase [Paenibacillus sp. FSL R5-0744]|uniref:class I SAM-dependent methyltransferase n=1 Tax=Paenibacillus sp. FSL R5-0744 TaxID=2921656 RepID=UPI0030DD91FB
MAWDQTWENVFKTQEWGKYPSEDLIRFVARNFYGAPSRKEIKILEVGCGTGANLWYVAREGFSVYGIDGSKTAVEKANARLNSEIPGWSGELLIGDIISLPYNDAFFDAVIDNEAIATNSYDNAVEMYNEIYRVLKPNGKVYSRSFSEGSWGDGNGEQVGHNAWIPNEGPLNNKGLSRFASKEDMEELLNKFQIVELERLERTYNNLNEKVIEWIVTGEKI